MNTKLAFLLIPILGACSGTGSSVVPMKVAAPEYENWSCQQLADEQMRLSVAMTIPNSPDRQPEYDAITQTMNGKNCSGPKSIVTPSSMS
jgi:hypothetical protein